MNSTVFVVWISISGEFGQMEDAILMSGENESPTFKIIHTVLI